ncbi:RBCS1 [Auxenochlorella protothecoides x Auxenochlorella symbiontica]
MATLSISASAAVCLPVGRTASTTRSQPRVVSRRAPFVSNGNIKRTTAMLVWTPTNNKMFETFSFLPPLSDDQISRQVDYIISNKWIPCLEFIDDPFPYVAQENTIRMGAVASNYYDNRYWTMWKLPMFGCNDGSQVLTEVGNCRKAFPDAYIRLVAFDNVRQVQIGGFLVHRPPSANDFQPTDKRSV